MSKPKDDYEVFLARAREHKEYLDTYSSEPHTESAGIIGELLECLALKDSNPVKVGEVWSHQT